MLKRTITFLLVSLSIFSISTKNTFASNYNIGFEPSCESILLLNLDSDCVVYIKNPDKKMPLASLSKMMTFLIAIESIKEGKVIGTTVGVQTKQQILDLLK